MPKLTRAMKVSVALVHALLPLFFAVQLHRSPEYGGWPAPVDWILGVFWLVSVGIFTSELLLLQKYPDEPSAMAGVLLLPPTLVAVNAAFFGANAEELLLEMATFYLALYILVMLSLGFRRLVSERTVKGWAWWPTGVALVLMFVPSLTALYVFVQTLVGQGVLSSPLNAAIFALSVGIAARYEVCVAYRMYPRRAQISR